MKKVLMIVPSLVGGGAEKVVLNVINNIATNNVDITLLIVHDVDIKIISNPKINLVILRKPSVSKSIFDIIKLLYLGKFDSLFVTHYHYAMLTSFFVFFFKTKIIFRESSIRSFRINSPVKKILTKLVYRYLIDYFVAQSKYMKEDLTDEFGVSETKIKIIPNSLDISDINSKIITPFSDVAFDMNKKNLVSFGRFEKVKGFDLLIDEIYILSKRMKNFEVHIFGEGKEKDNLLRKIFDAGLKEIVHLHSYTNNPYVYISAATLLVIPSRIEGFPNVAIESAYLDCPVFSFDIPGGIQDIPFIHKFSMAKGCLSDGLYEFLMSEPPCCSYKANLEPFINSVYQYESLLCK